METVEHIHLNPVRQGLVKRGEEWKGLSVPEHAAMSGEEGENTLRPAD